MLATLARPFRALGAHRRRQHDDRTLAGYEARLLDDMGVSPAAVAALLERERRRARRLTMRPY